VTPTWTSSNGLSRQQPLPFDKRGAQ
jgi:hypothetical protein